MRWKGPGRTRGRRVSKRFEAARSEIDRKRVARESTRFTECRNARRGVVNRSISRNEGEMRNAVGQERRQESTQSTGQVLGDCQGCNTHKRQVLECIDCLCPLSASRVPTRICYGNTPFSPRETQETLKPRENAISSLLSDYPSFPGTRVASRPTTTPHARFSLSPSSTIFLSLLSRSLIRFFRPSCPAILIPNARVRLPEREILVLFLFYLFSLGEMEIR